MIMEFNEKLQELRKQKKLTQEELANALFVSRAAVSKWESARGYPNIDSLKALAKFFGVTIDELLSSEELLTIASKDTMQAKRHYLDLTFGLLDCSIVLFCFLPFFGQKSAGIVQAVSLLSLNGISSWLKGLYFAVTAGMALCGILTLALQRCQYRRWTKHKTAISLVFNTAGTLLFIISLQPYAAAYLFAFLLIKAFLLRKKP